MRLWVILLAGVALVGGGCGTDPPAPVRRVERGVIDHPPGSAPLVPPVTRAPRRPVADGAAGVAVTPAPRGRIAELPPIDEPAEVDRRENILGPEPSLVYNKATEITVHGAINGFARIPLTDGRTGLLVRINAGGDFPYIYLGPAHWLLANEIDPQITQRIVATGSRSGQVILARQLIWNGLEFDLRTPEGVPYWEEPAIAASPADPDLQSIR